jgi:hypothetical protein
VPKILGPVPFDIWEREVRSQLSNQLPADWIVVCDVSYCWRTENGSVRDGQADFVVLVPEMGMAIVEVKGTKRVWVDKEGLWYSVAHRDRANKRTRLAPPPPEQANKNMHNLADKIKEELGQEYFPGLFAWLVVYPNGEVEGKLDLYFTNSIVTRKNIHQLKAAIEKVLGERGSSGLGQRFTAEIALRASKILTNGHFVVRGVDTELDVVEDNKDIGELTRQQFAALRGAFELPRVSIVGPAGSGKTVLALWKLFALLEEGKKAIYVCFNRSLAEFLKIQYPDASDSIVRVDQFFSELVRSAGSQGRLNYFSEILPELVLEYSLGLDEEDKYDAIIVDEGQDFGESRLTALNFLLRDDAEGSQWMILSDQKQDLYKGGDGALLDEEVTFRLYHNCRNTRKLNTATNGVCRVDVQSMPGVPEGEQPRVALCRSDLMAQKAWDLVRELSPKGGAVILSPFTLENSCMKGSPKGHGLELTRDIAQLGLPGYVFFSTIKSFKGLEADHVVFVHADLSGANMALAIEDLYVAFTRATTRLDVVTTNKAAEAWYQEALQKIV